MTVYEHLEAAEIVRQKRAEREGEQHRKAQSERLRILTEHGKNQAAIPPSVVATRKEAQNV